MSKLRFASNVQLVAAALVTAPLVLTTGCGGEPDYPPFEKLSDEEILEQFESDLQSTAVAIRLATSGTGTASVDCETPLGLMQWSVEYDVKDESLRPLVASWVVDSDSCFSDQRTNFLLLMRRNDPTSPRLDLFGQYWIGKGHSSPGKTERELGMFQFTTTFDPTTGTMGELVSDQIELDSFPFPVEVLTAAARVQ
ncbi:MAG TPA: hypothetical protein VLC09_10180 [Polyangiaceae bacterium]|nr:hypothetical protein [Polyangiaceae bacterium]